MYKFWGIIWMILVNNKMIIDEGQTLVLTSDMLSATDSDSDNSLLKFIVI